MYLLIRLRLLLHKTKHEVRDGSLISCFSHTNTHTRWSVCVLSVTQHFLLVALLYWGCSLPSSAAVPPLCASLSQAEEARRARRLRLTRSTAEPRARATRRLQTPPPSLCATRTSDLTMWTDVGKLVLLHLFLVELSCGGGKEGLVARIMSGVGGWVCGPGRARLSAWVFIRADLCFPIAGDKVEERLVRSQMVWRAAERGWRGDEMRWAASSSAAAVKWQ